MRATLERAHLLKSLTHVHRVVERRNTIPILSNVLIRSDGSALNLKATDLDIEVTEQVPAMVEQGGATTVPAHMFHDIVRKLPEGAQIVLETNSDGATLTLSAGRSRFSLQILPEADFPDITTGSFSRSFALKAGQLKRLIDRRTIRGFRAVIDPVRLGQGHVAFTEVKLSDTREAALEAFGRAVLAIPEVEECHMIASSFDYLLKVRTSDIRSYRAVLGERISVLPHVASTSTFVAMETIKDADD